MLSVALASFALGAWQPRQPYLLEGEQDARGNTFSGLYDPTANAYVDTVQVVFSTNEVYEGGLEDNRFNGYGILKGETTVDDETFAWRFEGTFVDGRLEGEGSYLDNLGSYVGMFSNSLPNGQGVYRSNNGWRYEGEFLAGMMTGRGTVFLADGTSASGLFEDGMQVSTG